MPVRFLDRLFKRSVPRTKETSDDGQSLSAGAAYRSALARAPDDWQSLKALAESALQRGELALAIELFDDLIGRAPGDPELYYKRGNVHNRMGRGESAVADYDQAIALRPDYANAYCNRGAALAALQRWDEALASYERAVAINPRDHFAYFNQAAALKEKKQLAEALRSYDSAIASKPDYVEAHVNRGNLLQELARHESALESYDRAIEISQGYPEAYHGRAVALTELGRLDEALRDHDTAIALRSEYVDAHVNRGNVLMKLRRHDAAVSSYERALQLDPGFAKAHFGRGSALLALRRFAAAIDCFVRVAESTEHNKYLLGLRRHAQMHICDWNDLETDLERMAHGLRAGEQISVPLAVLAMFDSPPLQRLAAEAWVSAECPSDDSLGPITVRARGNRIRVGYFSPDFRLHPVSLLMAEFFELHDRSRFEVIAFAFGPKTRDEMTNRLAGVFDRFIDVDDRTDAEIALLAREIGIDIAVDLGGFTDQNRPKVFALRASPVQMSYIGYLGTMGASYMDYLVADQIVIPVEQREHYSEKIIYLPSYQATDSRRPEPRRVLTREELGLPSSGFVFCCFNSNYKIMPTTFSVWMRVLARVPGSTMFLYVDNETAQRNLTVAAEQRGVDPGRLIFGKRLSLEDYLARFRAMDLFLDTSPYNAGTTASDALWAGLPVLTCKGHSIASRIAASVLTAIGVPELIVSTYEEYEELAVRLALDRAELGRIRRTIADNRKSAPLFDCARFTRAMEQALSRIYERSQSGLPAEDIVVQP
jgi:predicted O-linked N-acetylglucosamine transferase (SPINDLY family)